MGYEIRKAYATATVSRHNSDRDTRHDDLWKDFITTIQYLASNAKYKEIQLHVTSDLEEV